MRKEGGKVNEDCHPRGRGRGRGRQEGVKRDGGRVKEGTSGPRASCLFSALPQPVLASAPTPSSLPKAEGKEGRREEEEGEASGKLF